MHYLLDQFALWLAAALVLGVIIGFAAARRKPGQGGDDGGSDDGGRANGRLWIALYLVLVVAGAVVAAVRAVKGLNGLWFETLVLFAAAYLIGCLIGALLAGGAGHQPETAGTGTEPSV